MREKAIFNWSGGKDSAFCLYKLQQSEEYEILALLTSINKEYDRISIHGVRVDLLEKQAQSIGLPLVKLELPEMPDMKTYEDAMRALLIHLKEKGATASVFGDIFLEDLRDYREHRLDELGLKAVFPLWKIPTEKLIQDFISLGFKAIVTCVNDKYLDKSFAGRVIDQQFLRDLPENVDPCGENGEFHTFVYDGPIFSQPVLFEKGELVYKNYMPEENKTPDTDINYGFWYCDLVPLKA